MVPRVQRRVVLQRKLKHLQSRARSKSVMRESSIHLDALSYINELKLRLETIIREYTIMLEEVQVPTEVKAEKMANGLILIKVTSKKGRDVLISVLECFEKMGLNVLQARVSCIHWFCMEAIVQAQENLSEVRYVTQAILKAIGGPQ